MKPIKPGPTHLFRLISQNLSEEASWDPDEGEEGTETWPRRSNI